MGKAGCETEYYVCCRDGNERRIPDDERCRRRRESRKLNQACISRIIAKRAEDGSVDVTFISCHTNHVLSVSEEKHLCLPSSVKEEVATKLALGIPKAKIVKGVKISHLLYLCF